MSKQIKKLCKFAHKDLCECIDENCVVKSVFWDKAFSKLMEEKRYHLEKDDVYIVRGKVRVHGN